MKILVVEDEKILNEAINAKLESEGIETVTCETGEQALSYLDKGDFPDAIWLDYYLGPGMNGLDLLLKLKEYPPYKNIPVIVVSNSANYSVKQNMHKLGVRKIFLKAENRLETIIQCAKALK